ncbi:hypothetical protein BKA70DRAFT_1272540 [Coprinopsis sp. MPI-PUGE-AT-0042]|nr:hypothetical protein BKA70DRAFT_1272540 [Coprinopsis sp. MPI-PUGE-AT-0042]
MPTLRNVRSFMTESFWLGKPSWFPKDMPDLTGKVVIVTGGNSGLGRDTVKSLLVKDARVYMACRSEEKAKAVIEELAKETGKTALFLKLELSDLGSVERAAEDFLQKEQRLDILFNNAGISPPTGPEDPANLTPEGYDTVFETNVTGHFYFTQLLLPVLISTAESAEKGSVRIINLSSCGHHMVGSKPIEYETLRESKLRRKRTATSYQYYQSKFGNLLVSNELAKRYGDKNIVSIAVHPGIFDTQITTKLAVDFIMNIFIGPGGLLFRNPREWGSLTQLWAGTSAEAASLNGKYVVPWGKLGTPRPESNEEKHISELWTWLEKRVQEHKSKSVQSTQA